MVGLVTVERNRALLRKFGKEESMSHGFETVGLVESGYGRLEYDFLAESSRSYNLSSDLIMPEIVYPQEDGEPVVVNLGNPYVAAVLAWLIPGAGHFYQRRFVKGALFMFCVLVTYFVGLGLGHGRVVYASLKKDDFRWHYPLFQIHCGIVTLPAMVQAQKTKDGGDPYWILCERYPADYEPESLRFSQISKDDPPAIMPKETLKDGFMAPPPRPRPNRKKEPKFGEPDLNKQDALGRWHFEYRHFFELGTLYTMVAGILNLLAVYDAFCGPAILTADQRSRLESKKKRNEL